MLVFLEACSLAKRDNCGNKQNADNENDIPDITDATYLNEIDEYVSYIRENGENMTILKNDSQKENVVLFLQDNDTVKISVLADSNACTDIYFQNSTPIFVTRDIILDVDSCYMETAYFKNGKIFKCFKDGEEITDKDYIDEFEDVVMGK
ncbi:MAG: hypothetical protein MJZ61_01775 [Bacteroidales bacterium]|nr:hypothetical protein [Bacteroidales bacterium]